MTEDLSVYFVDHGVDGTLAGLPVRVIFDSPAGVPSLGDQGATVADPQVQIVTASVPASVFGAELVIPQGTFTVREHLPDGTGMSLLLLTKG